MAPGPSVRRGRLKSILELYIPASFVLALIGIVIAVAGAAFGSRLLTDIGTFATLPFTLPFAIFFIYVVVVMPPAVAFLAIEGVLPPFPGRRVVAISAAVLVFAVSIGLLALLLLAGPDDYPGSGIWYRGMPVD